VLAATLAQMRAKGGADALQAEKDLRGGVKYSSNSLKKCNWWDAAKDRYCDKKAGYSGDRTTGLFRCILHGGNKEQLIKSSGDLKNRTADQLVAGNLCTACGNRKADGKNTGQGGEPCDACVAKRAAKAAKAARST
tara:strand:+ start:691 stop:1098 length:408 start_codon:yes stop_codon:yes gene_type:complete